MTKEFLNNILESKKNDENKQSGYCLIEAISNKGNEQFMNFYAVPDRMKNVALEDPAILLQSANVKNLYKTSMETYNSNADFHNSAAEEQFSLFRQQHGRSASR